MSVKKYKICDNQTFSRTPTPPTISRPLSGTRPRSLVKISLSSTSSELLIKPGSIDIFNSSVIPAIYKFDIPPEPEQGPRIAVKLPSENRICRRFNESTKVGSLRRWITEELNQDNSENTSSNDNFIKPNSGFVLKLVTPSRPPKILDNENCTLKECGLVTDTLLVLEND
ncbi:hypothetical protein ACHWQZ_G015216 [Mnemiopsis leidyi]